MALRAVERDAQGVAVAVGLNRLGDGGHRGRTALGQPTREFRAGLQRGVGQRLGHHCGQGRTGRVYRPQHVVTRRRSDRPSRNPRGQLIERGVDGCDADRAGIVDAILGQRECCVLQPEFGGAGQRADSDDRVAEKCTVDRGVRLRDVDNAQRHTEYFLTSSCLNILPVSERGSCGSNAIDFGHL